MRRELNCLTGERGGKYLGIKKDVLPRKKPECPEGRNHSLAIKNRQVKRRRINAITASKKTRKRVPGERGSGPIRKELIPKEKGLRGEGKKGKHLNKPQASLRDRKGGWERKKIAR